MAWLPPGRSRWQWAQRSDPSLQARARPCRDDGNSANWKPQAPGSDCGYWTPLVAAAKSGATGQQVFCVLLACHVNRLCGRLACFKEGLNGFATLAVYLELHAELGGEA